MRRPVPPADPLGRAGEDLVADRFEAAGIRVVARNWRGESGEIDIVALDAGPGGVGRPDLVVCEVKTRSGTAWGDPGEAVDFRKQRRLRGVAAELLRHLGRGAGIGAVRFDVVEVVWVSGGGVDDAQVRHIRDAF